MTTPDTSATSAAQPAVGACPRCGARLSAAIGTPNAACPSCHLALGGPLVAELSDLNRHHGELQRYRNEVLAIVARDLAANERRRGEVLAALEPASPTAAGQPPHQAAERGRPAGGNGRGTQALLLGLGVLCLAIAVAVFAAVGWGRLNPAGQAAVLLAATVVAGFGGLALHRRGLRATGEAVLCLAAAMVLVDIAVFGDALGAGAGDLRFWSGGLALLAALGAATRRWGGAGGLAPPSSGALIGVVAAQLTLPMAVGAALGRHSSTGFDLTLGDPGLTQVGIAGVAVVGIVQAIVVTLVTRERRWSPASPVVGIALLIAAAGWFVSASMALALNEPTAAAAILAGAAIAATLAALLPQLGSAWTNLAAAGTAAAALGAWTALAPDALSLTVWVATGAALAVLAACTTPQRSRWGGALVAGLVLAGTTWVLLAAGGSALDDLTTRLGGTPEGTAGADYSWAEVLAVAMIVTAAVVGALMILARHRNRRAWIGPLTAAAVVLIAYLAMALPPLIGVSQLTWAIVLTLAAAAGAAAVTAISISGAAGAAIRAAGWAAAGTTAAAALALGFVGDDLDLWWALTGVAALLAVLTGRAGRTIESTGLAGVAGLLTVVGAASTAALFDAGPTWVAIVAVTTSGVLAVATAAIVWAAEDVAAAGRVSRSVAGAIWSTVARPFIALMLGAQAVALVVAVVDSIDRQAAVSGTVNLLIGAICWFAVSILIRQGLAAAVGAVLSQFAAWLALGIAGVGLVEAYTVPGALVLLALGAEAMRRSPQRGSWMSLSPALVVALVPSSMVAIADGGARMLALIAVGALLVIVGGLLRLGAPVVAGACCVVTLSFVEVAPLVGSLPRYLTFGTAGAVLLVTGATFERRRAELRSLHRQLRSLR
ncbi:MAG: DUF2157 domain-containing protein [Candidatus Microthrix sp.]|nr:DUF2157 domain-containing protein [Candidatus Microthrix sp.]